ncbi:transposase [Streptomyces sp. NPDC127066]|uniref:transposase n=1 Tax=Streptomyces sp. NPDC127066 TaxID=3347125 RepID=UPI003663E4C5
MELLGLAPHDSSRQSRQDQGFSRADFTIDWEEALEAVRQAQDTDEWKDRYAIRVGIEGTISQAVRVTGLRRTRYRNLPTTCLGHIFAATALNIIRIDRWLTGTPLGGTRTSRLEALMLAA